MDGVEVSEVYQKDLGFDGLKPQQPIRTSSLMGIGSPFKVRVDKSEKKKRKERMVRVLVSSECLLYPVDDGRF